MDCKEVLQGKIDAIVNRIGIRDKLSEARRAACTTAYQAFSAISDSEILEQINNAQDELDDAIAVVDDITETLDSCLQLVSGGCVDSTINEASNLAKGFQSAVDEMINSITGAMFSTIGKLLDTVMKYINEIDQTIYDLTDLDNYMNCSADIADSDYIQFLQETSDTVDGYLTNMGLNDEGSADMTKTMDTITSTVTGVSDSIKDEINYSIEYSKEVVDTVVDDQKSKAAVIVSDAKNTAMNVPNNIF